MSNTIKASELKELLKNQPNIPIIDVRRKSDYLAELFLIPGAEWHDPEEIEKWSETVSKDRKVIIYCVKGGSVSKSVSDYLGNKQIETAYLEGGLKAWKDSGGRMMNVSDPDIPNRVMNFKGFLPLLEMT